MSKTRTTTIEPLQPPQASPATATATATPASFTADEKTRFLRLESDLHRASVFSSNALAEILLGLLRVIPKMRAWDLLTHAEKLGAAALSGESDVTLLRARMAAFQVEIGRAAEPEKPK